MFVSPKDAAQRLSDDRNLFKVGSVSSDIQEPTSIEVRIPAAHEVVEVIDEEVRNTVDIPDEAVIHPEEGLSLSKLDALIHPRAPSARLRNQVNAQVDVAEAAIVLGPSFVDRALGVSSSQSQAYRRGESSANTTRPYSNDPARKQKVADMKERIAETAAGRIESTLSLLTDDRLSRVKRATDLTRIAKDMAVVMEKVTPKDAAEGGIHFHLYKPEIKQENHYETIEVGSKV